jgi:hypothetical protein
VGKRIRRLFNPPHLALDNFMIPTQTECCGDRTE